MLSFNCFCSEFSSLRDGQYGTLWVDDLNVHHLKWLKYPSANTRLGYDFHAFSKAQNITQLVREPTRFNYLLDLNLCDIFGKK
jgi:hypothetical protein